MVDPLVSGLSNVLDLRVQQRSLTASNLANAETPGFRAKYIDFSSALQEAVDDQPMTGLSQTHEKHAAGATMGHAEIRELDPPAHSENDNSVLLERETARMSANSLMYQAVTQGLSRKMAMMKYAAANGRM